MQWVVWITISFPARENTLLRQTSCCWQNGNDNKAMVTMKLDCKEASSEKNSVGDSCVCKSLDGPVPILSLQLILNGQWSWCQHITLCFSNVQMELSFFPHGWTNVHVHCQPFGHFEGRGPAIPRHHWWPPLGDISPLVRGLFSILQLSPWPVKVICTVNMKTIRQIVSWWPKLLSWICSF